MDRMRSFIVLFTVATGASLAGGKACAAEQMPLFQRTLTTSIEEPVKLNVALTGGNVNISYTRDDQVAIYASGKEASGKNLSEAYFRSTLVIEQKNNQISIRDSIGVVSMLSAAGVNYQILVPYRTEVDSAISGTGNQTLVGVYGPAKLVTGVGNINAKYVRFALLRASTGKGNVSCTRCFEVNAETGDGNITVEESGNSTAVVKTGRGKIEIGGARGTVNGSTASGQLHVKAVLWNDWSLQSNSGPIRIELPPKAKFDLEAKSESGQILVGRDDMEDSQDDSHHLQQQVNGGGKHIAAHSVKGSIYIE